MNDDMFQKWVEALLTVDHLQVHRPGECYMERLTKHVNMSRSNLQANIRKLLDRGFLEATTQNNRKMLGLTERGKLMADCLRQVYSTKHNEVTTLWKTTNP